VVALTVRDPFGVGSDASMIVTVLNVTPIVDAGPGQHDDDGPVRLEETPDPHAEDLPGGKEQGYIVPVDADLYEWARTMLAMKEIDEKIRKVQAKHILLSFDSCYSGLGLTRGIQIAPKQDTGYIDKMMRQIPDKSDSIA
jgi:hypothetical protein